MSDERDDGRAESDDDPDGAAEGDGRVDGDGRADTEGRVDDGDGRMDDGNGSVDDGDAEGCGGDGEVRVVVRHGDGETVTRAAVGTTLRDHLLDHGLSPYARLTERANCGGNGLCATCGVRLAEPPEPDHWHDDLADRFGYPRLSCQLQVREGMRVQLLDKRLWGSREPDDAAEPAQGEQR